jgi:hypothetical protein
MIRTSSSSNSAFCLKKRASFESSDPAWIEGGFESSFKRRDADLLPGFEPVVRLGALAVDAQFALADDALDMGEGQVGVAGGQEAIDPHPGLVRLDGDRLDADCRSSGGRAFRYRLFRARPRQADGLRSRLFALRSLRGRSPGGSPFGALAPA